MLGKSLLQRSESSVESRNQDMRHPTDARESDEATRTQNKNFKVALAAQWCPGTHCVSDTTRRRTMVHAASTIHHQRRTDCLIVTSMALLKYFKANRTLRPETLPRKLICLIFHDITQPHFDIVRAYCPRCSASSPCEAGATASA